MKSTPCMPGACTCDTAAHNTCAEVHIAGVLVHARAESLADVCVAVSLLPKAEITHETADGRVVAVLEAATAHGVVQQLEGIRSIKGVLNVALVYQHAEAEAEMDKEMQP